MIAPNSTAPPESEVELEVDEAEPAPWGPWRLPVAIMIGVAIAGGLVLRFVARSPLWLDEALSVNIAKLPLGQLSGALRHDGHPPLYYVLLHGWMRLFGSGNMPVRAFSGLWSLAVFPLLFVAARRVGGVRTATFAVALYALSPYGVRYGTETRMYAMVMVLVLVAWLLGDDALRRPTPLRLTALALTVGALLWTHYWAMWVLGAAGIALLWRAWKARRTGDADGYRATAKVIGAVVVGGLLFVPWLPVLLYQGAHTGTPWARPLRPTEMITYTLADLGGGAQAEALLLGWVLAGLAILGVFGHAIDGRRILLDLRSRDSARPFLVFVLGTLAIAMVVGYATGATYASRYAAVFVPFLLILAALGVAQVRSRPLAVGLLAGLLVLGGIGSVRNAVTDRTDAGRSAAAIRKDGQPGDVVLYCPDQLGPSTSRLLSGFDQVTYPFLKRPQRVDWVDYTKRLAAADPRVVAQRVLQRAGNRRIFLVSMFNYVTHKKSCAELYQALSEARPPQLLSDPTEATEPSMVTEFASPAPAPNGP